MGGDGLEERLEHYICRKVQENGFSDKFSYHTPEKYNAVSMVFGGKSVVVSVIFGRKIVFSPSGC